MPLTGGRSTRGNTQTRHSLSPTLLRGRALYNSSPMRRTVIALVASILFSHAYPAAAQIRAEVHLDKESYIAGEPVFVVWDYSNLGSTAVPFDRFDPYCEGPNIRGPLTFAAPTVFPYPHDGTFDCESSSAPLKPQETYEAKFLLNHRFDLTREVNMTLSFRYELASAL